MSSSSTNRTTTTTTSTTVVTKSKRLAGGSSSVGHTELLQESFASQFTGGGGPEAAAQRFKEITQNVLNAEFERSQQSSKAAAGAAGSNNSSINKSYSQILSNSNGDLSDHIAYLEYKRAGEYWNTTPKTDYTYSEHSPYRRELAPGIVAMPNMSRTGLKNHNDRINYMIQRDPAQEEYIRRRYEASRYAQNRRATEKLAYDSGDEIDFQLDSYPGSWYMRIITTILTTITNAWATISGEGGDIGTGGGVAAGYNSSLYRTNYGQEKRGFFGFILHGISSSITRLFRYIYLLISYVLCLDTWLLQSRSADNNGKKRGLLLILILAPLLLLGAIYYRLHPTETFPPSHFSEMTFTLPKLPDFSQINMSEYFNEDKYVAIKEHTLNRFEDFRAWSDDYIMYLRTVSNNILDEGPWWWLQDDENRLYYVERAQAVVPLSLLASWQSALYATGSSLRGYFLQLPDNVRSSFNQYYSSYIAAGDAAAGSGAGEEHIHNIEQRLQKALTAEEYENILNHVNSYVQQLIDLKLEKQQHEQTSRAEQLSPTQIHLIVQLLRENLERFALEQQALRGASVRLAELNESDVLRLAELVRAQLETSGWAERPVPLSNENLIKIKRLIGEHFELHAHEHYTLRLEQVDLDALLLRILSAPQLAKYVDTRIGAAFESKRGQILETEKAREGSGNTETHSEQQRLINELNNEIAFIKLALSDRLSENDGLHQSISKLKVTQDDLLKRLQDHELATDKRFSGLLSEIESKLAALKDDNFKLLNQQIKLSLVEILGFKERTPAGATLEDIDLQNWVRSMFVAKDYLEERLLALNKGTDNKIRDEIDRSGMLLMRDISERLKHEILVAVEAKHNESLLAVKGQINSALSENEVQKIVKSVLAIYDADKTGLVDFALESAGGQILSTRCTENYQTKSAQISIFGIPLWYPTNTPRIAISPQVQPVNAGHFKVFRDFCFKTQLIGICNRLHVRTHTSISFAKRTYRLSATKFHSLGSRA
ncbi:unnamed protein product [Ceratitis capitata]|uniref:(Mediterranean fruit fly) hypothetical protein n=1 Tax=Ceratitis capitata TaxID=7213 RepID=A0A811VA41_CERCA|nr:unnamed protein product [Ceratitis capitata]